MTNLVLRVCENLRIPGRNFQCYCSVNKAVFRLFNGDSKLNESKLGKKKQKQRPVVKRSRGSIACNDGWKAKTTSDIN